MNSYALTIIAALGAIIAYFQWRTAHQRIVLDLYDRRAAIRKDLKDAVGQAIQTGRADNSIFYPYLRAVETARMLFGPEVYEYLREIQKVLAFLESSHNTTNENWLNQRTRNLNDASNFFNRFDKLAEPYMRLDQKMPSFWSPFRAPKTSRED